MRITTGAELNTFINGLNADADIDLTLLNVLVDTACTIIEAERPWMVLRKTDKTLSLAAGENAAVDMSGITDFSEFYSDTPIKLYNSSANQIEYYVLMPFDRYLDYKDVSNTVCYDEANNELYFNGVAPFAGTLYIDYVSTTDGIDLESTSVGWSPFPSRFLPLLGFYAIGLHMGGVDYDTITARQAPNNLAVMTSLKLAMEAWDNKRQLVILENNDPTERYKWPRNRAIER